MTSPGLDNRLRQHGRRAGVMVGLTMALTIAVCIGAFTWIYLQVDPFTRDFVNAATAAPTKKATTTAQKAATAAPDGTGANDNAVAEVQPTKTPKPTPTSDAFTPTHRISLSIETNINLRPGPAVASGDAVAVLAPGTEVQYLNETQDSQDPDADPGVKWMKVRTADGTEGWVRADFLDPIGG